MRFVIDIEANNLLQNLLDYSQMPYRLKPQARLWCVVIRHVDSGATKTLVQDEITKENLQHALRKCTELIGHNIVGFDLPMLKLFGVLDYEIKYPKKGQPTGLLFGRPVEITDTLIWSKLLNADRLGGHSLEAWGKRLGNAKGDFSDWNAYSEQMLEYCMQDTSVNAGIYAAIQEEKGEHDWSKPYSMEIKLSDLTLRQELFGFEFNKNLAQECLDDLAVKMQEIAEKVNPLLPKKKLVKTEAAKFTPPKVRIKKDGTLSVHFKNFLERVGAKLTEDNRIEFRGKYFAFDYEGALLTEEPATIEDIDIVKSYLLSLGWIPSEIKERDITKNQDKTIKNPEQIKEAIERYVRQTQDSVFKDLRLGNLGVEEDQLQGHLLDLLEETRPQIKFRKMQQQRPIFLPTTPKLTVGVEKEICPNLIALGEKAEFVKDVVHYYTYRHRRNSIAGGVLDEDGEPITGFISAVREDGRIPTPADTLGANTGRYRHKVVCNVPRVTSLYGEPMRNLFGSGKGLWQLGYDFASLEARIMGHYVMPYESGPELAKALVAEKPMDQHSLLAAKLGIDRNSAKSITYACLPMSTKILTAKGMQSFDEVQVGDLVLTANFKKGTNEFVKITRKHFFEKTSVYRFTSNLGSFECTLDHRWYVEREGRLLDVYAYDLRPSDILLFSADRPGAYLYNLKIEKLEDQDVFCLSTENENFFISQEGYTGVTGNCIYGAQPKKLGKMLSLDEEAAKLLYNQYWDAVPALKALKLSVEKQWEDFNKKHILGLDGRLLSTRSKHSLINVLFQSGGAISAKWAAVRLAEYLQSKNLLGDPLLHSADDPKVWFMIHMHDEQQLAVHPSLMKVQGFASEEEAKSAIRPGCSAIGHGSKGPYLGFETEPVRAISAGIQRACKELGLLVDLGFEWIPGLSWGQCH